MVDGEHCRSDEPRRAEQRTDGNLDGNHQQVQVISGAFLLTNTHAYASASLAAAMP